MKAVRVHQTGGPEVLALEDLPTPEPGPGEVLVKLLAIGVNYIDTYFRRGLYPRSLHYIPGDEGSGVVHEAGPDVTAFAPGDRIAWAAAPGSYAEFVVVDAPPPNVFVFISSRLTLSLTFSNNGNPSPKIIG